MSDTFKEGKRCRRGPHRGAVQRRSSGCSDAKALKSLGDTIRASTSWAMTERIRRRNRARWSTRIGKARRRIDRLVLEEGLLDVER